MDYANVSENEIIAACKAGDDKALEYIFDKYKNYVRKKAIEFYIVGGDRDDLIQEGMIGLYKAIRDYNSDKETSFMTFAGLCINRQLLTAVKEANRKKHIPLNTSISYDSTIVTSSGKEEYLADMISLGAAASPEEDFIDRETVNNINDAVKKSLSHYENQVFEMYMSGVPYTEIALRLGKSPKSIDNAIQRIRSKIQKLLSI